jgi:hypothetical protein
LRRSDVVRRPICGDKVLSRLSFQDHSSGIHRTGALSFGGRAVMRWLRIRALLLGVLLLALAAAHHDVRGAAAITPDSVSIAAFVP